MDIQVVQDEHLSAWFSQEGPTPAAVSINMAWTGGSVQDGAGKEGIASLMASMLTEGAGDLDAEAFQKKMKDLGARVSCSADSDYIVCRVRMLRSTKESVFELTRLILTQPRFDEKAIHLLKDQYKSAISAELKDPSWVATHAFYQAAFPGHPYARPSNGTHASIDAITRGDLLKLKDTMIAQDNLKMSIVGPVSRQEVLELFHSVLNQLPKHASLTEIKPVRWHTGVRKEEHISQNSSQTVAVFGTPAPSFSDKDYIPAIVVNYILGGGGFSSRIMEEVREKRGLAYGASTSLVEERRMAGFIGEVGTQKDRMHESVAILKEELKKMARDGVTDKELADAKMAITGMYAHSYNSNSRKARLLLKTQLFGFDPSYIDRYPSLIEAVSMDDVKRVAKHYLSQEPTFGLAGDFSPSKQDLKL